jgi:uncharacterized protein involved in exopolysaccharide biosynthesis
MDEHQKNTPSSGSWTQNDAELDAEETGEALSIRLIRFLQLCWVRRRVVIGILTAGIVLSAVYAFLQPNIYISTTTLMPPDSTSSSSNLMSLLSSVGPAAGFGSSALGIKTPGAVFVSMLGSRTVQESLVKQFDLVHHYKKLLVQDACKQLAADTIIKDDTKSGIITISVKADSSMLASKIAQGYVTELDRVVTQNSTSAARRERIFLEGRLKEITRDMDDSAKALSQFSTKNRTIDIPSQGKAMVESGLKLQDQLVAARSELAGLRQSYSDDNVRVRAARARIAELERQIDKMMGSTAETRSAASNSAYPSVSELPALGLTYSDLARKTRVEEVLWEALTKQYEAAKVQEAKEIPTVRVLDVADVPERKSSPIRSRIVILGAMLSLLTAFVALIITFIWEEMDAEDERKRFVTEIKNALLNRLKWIRLLPGIS